MKRFLMLLTITALAMKKGNDVKKVFQKNHPKTSTVPEHTINHKMYETEAEIQDYFYQNDDSKLLFNQETAENTMDYMKCKSQKSPEYLANWWLPNSLDANLWLNILAMIGNCENLSVANATWNRFFHVNFNTLTWPDPRTCGQDEHSINSTPKEYVRAIVRACPWKLVTIVSMLDYKYEVVTAPMDGLAMKFNGGWQGVILDLSKTLVSFRFEDRNYALNSISPDIAEEYIVFVYKTIDNTNENAKKLQIEQNIWASENAKGIRVGKFYTQSFFHPNSSPLDRSLKTLRGVFFVASRNLLNGDITEAFLAADIEPKFYPKFAQTLLQRQQKLGFFQ